MDLKEFIQPMLALRKVKPLITAVDSAPLSQQKLLQYNELSAFRALAHRHFGWDGRLRLFGKAPFARTFQ